MVKYICPACKRELPSRKFTYKSSEQVYNRTNLRPHYKTSKVCEACRRAALLADPTGKRLQTAIARGEVPYVWGMVKQQHTDAARAAKKLKTDARANKSRAIKVTAHHVLLDKYKREGYAPDTALAKVKAHHELKAKTNASRSEQLKKYHAARRAATTHPPLKRTP